MNGSTVGRRLGGGIHIINGSPALRNLIIRNNSAHTRGGGIHISGSGHPQLTGIQLMDNHALDGGGMAVFGGAATLERVTFSENTADNSGGGLYVNSSSAVTVRNSLIHHNSTSNLYGGGIYNSASVLALTNVTVAENESPNNTGDGIMNTSSGQLSLINSIVYGNAGGAADYDLVNQNTVNSPTINYSIVGTYQGGVSRAATDPRFTDPEQGDFSLTSTSVAINSGDPETDTEGYPVQAGDWDVTGAARLHDGRIDMGALEYSGTVYRPFVTAWKTDNEGTSNDDQLTIPITGTGYDMAIDWGDGAITTWKDGDDVASLTHTYLAAGTYNVRISGDFPRIYFNNAGDRQKILDVVQWGDITWHSMEAAFAGAANMAMSATDAPDLSNVTSMKQMLMGAGAFDSPIGHWDVSTIEDMSQMFQQTVSFNQSLAAWDVTHVETMALMFNGAGLSTANYDAILMAWAEQDVQDDVPFGADQLTYCAGKAARQSLIDDRHWVFSGDNKAADCVTDGPVLVAPANGAYNVERPVTLQWEAVDGASGYHVRLIEAGGDFDSPFFSANSPTTSLEVTSLQGNYILFHYYPTNVGIC